MKHHVHPETYCSTDPLADRRWHLHTSKADCAASWCTFADHTAEAQAGLVADAVKLKAELKAAAKAEAAAPAAQPTRAEVMEAQRLADLEVIEAADAALAAQDACTSQLPDVASPAMTDDTTPAGTRHVKAAVPPLVWPSRAAAQPAPQPATAPGSDQPADPQAEAQGPAQPAEPARIKGGNGRPRKVPAGEVKVTRTWERLPVLVEGERVGWTVGTAAGFYAHQAQDGRSVWMTAPHPSRKAAEAALVEHLSS